MGNHTRLGERKRLLLEGFHVALHEIIVQGAKGLGFAVEVLQRNLRLVRGLILCDGFGQTALDALLARHRDLIIALEGLPDTLQLVHDRAADLEHLVAQIDDHQVVAPETGRKHRLPVGKFEEFAAQLVDDVVAKRVGDCGIR